MTKQMSEMMQQEQRRHHAHHRKSKDTNTIILKTQQTDSKSHSQKSGNLEQPRSSMMAARPSAMNATMTPNKQKKRSTKIFKERSETTHTAEAAVSEKPAQQVSTKAA